MPLLNYSTTVAVDKTLAEIQKMLAIHGAKSVLVDYDGQGNATGVSLLVPTRFGDRGFRLPANLDAVWRTMTRQYEHGRLPRRFATKEQAARVGWRIIREWLAAQLAIIETEMVTLDQVMLPYLELESGRTAYELLVERKLLALPSGQ